jgi:uncharacterized protein YjiS (DUF1127 family)
LLPLLLRCIYIGSRTSTGLEPKTSTRVGPTKPQEEQMLTGIIRFLRSWRRYHQSLNELSQLGDRDLQDIGISRSDIHTVAWRAAHGR